MGDHLYTMNVHCFFVAYTHAYTLHPTPTTHCSSVGSSANDNALRAGFFFFFFFFRFLPFASSSLGLGAAASTVAATLDAAAFGAGEATAAASTSG